MKIFRKQLSSIIPIVIALLCFSTKMVKADDHGFKIISDTVVYSRWRQVLRRVVEFPNGQVVDFDVVDQKGKGAVTIFAWDSKTQTATLVSCMDIVLK